MPPNELRMMTIKEEKKNEPQDTLVGARLLEKTIKDRQIQNMEVLAKSMAEDFAFRLTKRDQKEKLQGQRIDRKTEAAFQNNLLRLLYAKKISSFLIFRNRFLEAIGSDANLGKVYTADFDRMFAGIEHVYNILIDREKEFTAESKNEKLNQYFYISDEADAYHQVDLFELICDEENNPKILNLIQGKNKEIAEEEITKINYAHRDFIIAQNESENRFITKRLETVKQDKIGPALKEVKDISKIEKTLNIVKEKYSNLIRDIFETERPTESIGDALKDDLIIEELDEPIGYFISLFKDKKMEKLLDYLGISKKNVAVIQQWAENYHMSFEERKESVEFLTPHQNEAKEYFLEEIPEIYSIVAHGKRYTKPVKLDNLLEK